MSFLVLDHGEPVLALHGVCFLQVFILLLFSELPPAVPDQSGYLCDLQVRELVYERLLLLAEVEQVGARGPAGHVGVAVFISFLLDGFGFAVEA